jgi:hypothetical protein
MAHRKADTEAKKNSTPILDVITGRIGKIVALITAVVALLTVAQQMLGGTHKLAEIWTAFRSVPEEDCFMAEMNVEPTSVPLQKWNSVKFHLTGSNKCRATLAVHVAFKAQGGNLVVSPPFKGPDQPACTGYENPDCWEVKSLDKGKAVDWVLTPPRLESLSPLGNPVKIAINWMVFNTETKKQVRAGKAEITVKSENGS